LKVQGIVWLFANFHCLLYFPEFYRIPSPLSLGRKSGVLAMSNKFIVCTVLFLFGCSGGDSVAPGENGNTQSAPPTTSPDAPRKKPVSGNASHIDATPVQAARQILGLWKTKDIVGLFKYAEEPPPAEATAQLQPGGRIYTQLTDPESWRWQAVTNWDGNLSEVKVREEIGLILMKKPADDMNSERLVCLTLVKSDGQWMFDGVFEPTESYFSDWGEADPRGTNSDGAIPQALQNVTTAFKTKKPDLVRQLSAEEYLADLPELHADPSGSSQEPTIDEQIRHLASGYGGGYDEIVGWDGTVLESRLRKQAWVKFGENAGEVFVVELKQKLDEWKFEDILSPSRQDYAEWGEVVDVRED
jgi:hypothetical protein